MRPYNAPSLKARRGQARRSLRQSLPWLPGWPVERTPEGVLWQPVSGDQIGNPLVLTGLNVADATRFRTRAASWEHDLRREVVGGSWENQVSVLLGLIQAAIHHHQPLPQEVWHLHPREVAREARQTMAHHPPLRSLLHALSYWTAPEPTQAILHLKTINRYPFFFEKLLSVAGVAVAMVWLEIILEAPRLASWLNDPRTWTLDLCPPVQKTVPVTMVAVGLSWAWNPPPCAPLDLLPLLNKLHLMEQKYRSRALILLSRLLPVPEGVLGPWQAWWDDVHAFTRWFRSHSSASTEALQELSARIRKWPATLSLSSAFLLAIELGEDPQWEVIVELLVAIERLAPSFSLLLPVQALSERIRDGYLDPLPLRRLTSWLARAELPESVIPNLVTRSMLYPLLSANTNALGFAMFEEFLQMGEIPPENKLHTMFFLCSLAPARARSLWEWIRDLQSFWYGLFELLLKVEVPEVSGGDIRSLYLRFCGDPSMDLGRVLKVLSPNLRILGFWLAMGKRSRLELLNRLLILSRAQPRFPLEVPSIPDWAARFPAALAPALGRLASVHPTAEQVASSILSKEFPDPQELLRTVRYLEFQITQPGAPEHLKIRLKTLKGRLHAPPLSLSLSRMHRLIEKLDHACSVWILENWMERAEQDVRQRLSEAAGGMTGLSSAFWEPRPMMAISALLDLSGQSRELSHRILQVRSGPPPWDFRDEPANVVFLERLRQQKINVGPWLSGWRTEREIHNQRVVFGLEMDPLEVLWMGEHFQSCLSFGGCNFFSVISNIVDINKQVLYGWRDGRVVLRCLLALTDEGGLLSFTLYRHIKEDGLDEIFMTVIRDLAAAMNTILLGGGG